MQIQSALIYRHFAMATVFVAISTLSMLANAEDRQSVQQIGSECVRNVLGGSRSISDLNELLSISAIPQTALYRRPLRQITDPEKHRKAQRIADIRSRDLGITSRLNKTDAAKARELIDLYAKKYSRIRDLREIRRNSRYDESIVSQHDDLKKEIVEIAAELFTLMGYQVTRETDGMPFLTVKPGRLSNHLQGPIESIYNTAGRLQQIGVLTAERSLSFVFNPTEGGWQMFTPSDRHLVITKPLTLTDVVHNLTFLHETSHFNHFNYMEILKKVRAELELANSLEQLPYIIKGQFSSLSPGIRSRRDLVYLGRILARKNYSAYLGQIQISIQRIGIEGTYFDGSQYLSELSVHFDSLRQLIGQERDAKLIASTLGRDAVPHSLKFELTPGQGRSLADRFAITKGLILGTAKFLEAYRSLPPGHTIDIVYYRPDEQFLEVYGDVVVARLIWRSSTQHLGTMDLPLWASQGDDPNNPKYLEDAVKDVEIMVQAKMRSLERAMLDIRGLI